MNPRPLDHIVRDYNNICFADDLLIEEMELYRIQDMPKKLVKKHEKFGQKLRELDEERYTSIDFAHNLYRHHYAQMYPLLLNQSIIKQNQA